MRCRRRNSQASSRPRGTPQRTCQPKGSKSSAHSLCEDVVHAGVKKFLTEHTPSFVSSQKQLQKMLRGGSVIVKPLLWTFRAALCTLTSSTCAEKKRSLPETLNHGPCNSDGKDCTFGSQQHCLEFTRTWLPVLLAISSTPPRTHSRFCCRNCPLDRRSASQKCGPLNWSCNVH